MGRALLSAVLAALILLSGCTPAGEENSSQMGSQTPAASSSVAPDQPQAAEAARLSVDLDGDGAGETVRLCARPAQEGPEDGSAPLSLWYLETEGGGVWELTGDHAPYGPDQEPVFFSLEDQNGRPLVAAGLAPAAGDGLPGQLEVHVLAWEGEEFVPLTVPSYSVMGVRDGMTAQVTVLETGNTEELDLNWWLEQRQAQPVVDGNGTLLWPVAPAYYLDPDGIVLLAPAQRGVRLVQAICGQSVDDRMGYLVTQVTWDDGVPMLLDQYFDWQAGSLDELDEVGAEAGAF